MEVAHYTRARSHVGNELAAVGSRPLMAGQARSASPPLARVTKPTATVMPASADIAHAAHPRGTGARHRKSKHQATREARADLSAHAGRSAGTGTAATGGARVEGLRDLIGADDVKLGVVEGEVGDEDHRTAPHA